MLGEGFRDAKAPRSKDPLEMIVDMADCWKDIVEHAEALLRFDNDLLLKAFRESLAALASALYLFLIVEVFSELALFLLLRI